MTDRPYDWRSVESLKQELAAANATIREHYMADVHAGIAARAVEAASHAEAQRAADQRVRDDEIESVRVSSWYMHTTRPENFDKFLANNFSPTWIADQTPKTGWPEGDGPENHHYSATAPEPEPLDDGVVPPLVLRARQMGLDV